MSQSIFKIGNINKATTEVFASSSSKLLATCLIVTVKNKGTTQKITYDGS